MGKRVIFAVAGSGKTSYLIDKLNLKQRFLIVTYTDNNELNIRQRVIAKFGYIPSNIHILGYFTFLYSFCYRSMLGDTIGAKGINFELPPEAYRKYKQTCLAYYLDEHRRLFSNRIALLCIKKQCLEDIKKKIAKYFDCFFIDEFQDFAGYDFDFALQIAPETIDTIYVGDYYQHTYSTSVNGNKNQNLYEAGFQQYLQRFRNEGWIIDTTTLLKSYRCPIEVCSYIKTNLGIEIEPAEEKHGNIELITDVTQIEQVLQNDTIIKLFLKESRKYNCRAMNWGDSKGLDSFGDVCVVLNKGTYKAYTQNTLKALAPLTKNKFYVACTRTKGNLYFIQEAQIGHYKIL